MTVPNSIAVKANNIRYEIDVFSKDISDNVAQRTFDKPAINIFASGPSIADVDFNDDLLRTPCMFVNGSISLTKQHDFQKVVGYVISDKRFIKHNPEVLAQYYTGQPLFATQAVFKAIALQLPDLIKWYHKNMTVIFPADRPLLDESSNHWLSSIPLVNKLVRQKKSLHELANHASFVITSNHKPIPIGVSLNVSDGFIEAGTVAFIAMQLAYTLQYQAIHLYGIDLINSNQPRFYETNDNNAPSMLDKAITDRIIPSFDLLGREYKKRGVTVTNHSPVSQHLFKAI